MSLTPFDQEAWDNANHAHADDDVSGLPEDARELYHELMGDGAASRERIAQIDQRLRERVALLSATQAGPTPEPVSEAAATVSTLRSAPQRSRHAEPSIWRAARSSAPRRWVTILATAAVVAAFVTVLSMNAGRRSGGPQGGGTPTVAASPTSAPAGWIDLTQLDYSTSFSANDLPVVAPSDPRVVYETMAQGMQQHQPATLRATSDGGITWRKLPTPVPADHIGHAGFIVSPIDPQTVFLTVADTTVADCPPTSVVNSGGGGYESYCWIQYSSFDGGAHWSLTRLPLVPGSSYMGGLTAGMDPGMPAGFGDPITSDPLGAQGRRIYSGAVYPCPNARNYACFRLITSDDGGHIWRFTDLPLRARGAASVCDYTASRFSADLYAVTAATNCDFRQQAARTLWRSVDAGATWVKVRRLATPNEAGIALAQDRATGATLLYLAAPATTSYTKDKMGNSIPVISQSPSDVKVSLDGGATWQSAPRQGIPDGHKAFFGVGLLGPLSDGSIVIDVIPPSADSDNFQGSDLYAWKPGESGWRLIGSVSLELDGLLVIPAQSGDGDTVYAFLTTRSDADTFTILRKHVAPKG
jgi:hypothetical protein